MSEFKTRTNERELNVENILKGIHIQRQGEITNVLKDNRRPEDYLRRMDREDKRYHEVTEALRRYFLPVDEWKKEEERIEWHCSYGTPDKCSVMPHQRCVPSKDCENIGCPYIQKVKKNE